MPTPKLVQFFSVRRSQMLCDFNFKFAIALRHYHFAHAVTLKATRQKHSNACHLLSFTHPFGNGASRGELHCIARFIVTQTALAKVATTVNEVEEVVASTLASSVARALVPILIFSARA